MSALDKNPESLSALSPSGFTLFMRRSPNVNFWAQKVSIPGFSIPNTKMPTPFTEIPYSGEHIDFETFDVLFTVDEEMTNYLEIWTWLKALGFPKEYKQFADLLKNPEWTSLAIKSEIVVTILSNKKNPLFTVTLHNAFPIGISRIDFDSRLTGQDATGPIYCSASFKYSDYDIERVIRSE